MSVSNIDTDKLLKSYNTFRLPLYTLSASSVAPEGNENPNPSKGDDDDPVPVKVKDMTKYMRKKKMGQGRSFKSEYKV